MKTRLGMQALCALLAAFCASSCAFIGSMQHYRPTDRETRDDGVSASVPSVHIFLIGFVVGGEDSGLYRVPWHESELEVASGGVSWGQHWFGPILPFIPFPFGAGTMNYGIDLYLGARRGDVTIVPGDVLVRATRTTEASSETLQPMPPRKCHRLAGGEIREGDEPLPLTEPLTLARGQRIKLTYPLSSRSTQEFEVLLPTRNGDPARSTLSFRYEDNEFLFWCLLPLVPLVSF